uniref:AHH domain-containing protein n=1 Tax=Stigmatella hybrida TaxID=394097 RepID=UPI001CDAFA7D
MRRDAPHRHHLQRQVHRARGAWTPRFRALFAKAGVALNDPANKMPLPGHYGPHPERYHQIILKELTEATETCRTVVECRQALTGALRMLVAPTLNGCHAQSSFRTIRRCELPAPLAPGHADRQPRPERGRQDVQTRGTRPAPGTLENPR